MFIQIRSALSGRIDIAKKDSIAKDSPSPAPVPLHSQVRLHAGSQEIHISNSAAFLFQGAGASCSVSPISLSPFVTHNDALFRDPSLRFSLQAFGCANTMAQKGLGQSVCVPGNLAASLARRAPIPTCSKRISRRRYAASLSALHWKRPSHVHSFLCSPIP